MSARHVRCAQEAHVHHACVTGRWTPALSSHVDECAQCATDVRMVRMLRQPLPPVTPAVPHADASVLWLAGRHARRVRVETQASTLLAVGHMAALVAAAAVLVAWLVTDGDVMTRPAIELMASFSIGAALAAGAIHRARQQAARRPGSGTDGEALHLQIPRGALSPR